MIWDKLAIKRIGVDFEKCLKHVVWLTPQRRTFGCIPSRYTKSKCIKVCVLDEIHSKYPARDQVFVVNGVVKQQINLVFRSFRDVDHMDILVNKKSATTVTDKHKCCIKLLTKFLQLYYLLIIISR